MANTVLVQSMVQAKNIDALNRTAKGSVNIENGTAIGLAFPTVDGSEVFTASLAQSGLVFKIGRQQDLVIASQNLTISEKVTAYLLEVTENTADVWMAYSPEVNKLVVGNVWGGQDPRNFTNLANKPFDVFKPVVGDIIQVSVDFFSTAPIAGNNTVTLTAGAFVPATV